MPKAWQFLWFDVPVAPEKLTTDTGIPPLPLENYYSFTNTQFTIYIKSKTLFTKPRR